MSDAARSLSFDLSWDIETKKLNDANKMTDNLKTSATEMFKATDDASKAISTSGSDISKQFKAAGSSVDTAGDKIVKTDKKAGKLDDTTKEIGDSAEDTAKDVEKIGKEAEKAEKKTGGLAGAMKNVGKAAAIGLAAAAAGGIAIGKMAIDAQKQYQDYTKTIVTGTGASGEALDGLMGSFEKLGRNSDDDLGYVAATMSDVNTRLGYTGMILEDYTQQIMDMGDITGDNFEGMSEASGKMVNAWQLDATQAADSLDKIFVASQATGIGAVELTDSVTKFGPALKEMGFGLDESIALLGNFEKAGIDGDLGIKGMQLAMVKMSKEGVTDLNAGMADLINNISGMTDPAKQTQAAIDAFGPAGLRMADAIRAGTFEMEDMMAALDEAPGALARNAEATETFEEKMSSFKNNMFFMLKDIGAPILDAFAGVLENLAPVLEDAMGDIAPIITDMVESIGPLVGPIVTLVADLIKNLLPVVAEIFGAITPLLSAVVEAIGKILPPIMKVVQALLPVLAPVIELISGIVGIIIEMVVPIVERVADLVSTLIIKLQPLIQKVLPVIMTLVSKVADVYMKLFEAIMPIIETILPPLIDLLVMIVDTILPPFIDIFMVVIESIMPPLIMVIESVMSVLQPLIEMFMSIVSVVLPPLMEVIQVLAGILSGVLGAAFENIGNIIGTVMGIFGGLIDFITGVFTGNWKKAWQGVKDIFSSIVSGLGNIFKAPINFIIKGINAFLSGLNKIKIPDWVPLVGGKGFNISLIPQLAEGTDFFEGGIALVGERGPELVSLPTGTGVMPNEKTQRLFTRTEASGSGEVYNVENSVSIEINADGADEVALEKLRSELKIEIPRALEKAFKKMYLKNKPA